MHSITCSRIISVSPSWHFLICTGMWGRSNWKKKGKEGETISTTIPYCHYKEQWQTGDQARYGIVDIHSSWMLGVPLERSPMVSGRVVYLKSPTIILQVIQWMLQNSRRKFLKPWKYVHICVWYCIYVASHLWQKYNSYMLALQLT